MALVLRAVPVPKAGVASAVVSAPLADVIYHGAAVPSGQEAGFPQVLVFATGGMTYEIQGEDQNGRITGRHKGTGVGRPRFWERARYFGLEKELAQALDEAEQA
jgi:pilus assembly protein CpaF